MEDVLKLKIRFRRSTASDWTTKNPVLLSGEPAVETDTGKFKIGDGVKTWTALPYVGGGGTGDAPALILDHNQSPAAHLDIRDEIASKVDNADARLTDDRTPKPHNHVQSDVTGLSTAYDHSQVVTGNPHGTTAADVGVDASGFNGNLTTSDDTVQEIAQKLDDLVIPAAGIPATIIDAKGDLIVGTAADTAARLPVGVNGCVLTADSSVSGGVKWAAPSTPAYIGGAYHLLTGLPSDLPGSAAMVPGANTLVAQLVHIHEPIAVSGRWLYVQTAAPSAVFRPAIYAASTSTGMPTGEPLVTSPAVDASSTGFKLDTFTASAVIPAGFYWEITASSSNTAGFRGGHNTTVQPQVDMGHASGGTYSIKSFIASWAYSGAAMPDVSAFSWTARTANIALPPYLRWRIER